MAFGMMYAGRGGGKLLVSFILPLNSSSTKLA